MTEVESVIPEETGFGKNRYHRLQVADVIVETHDSKSVVFTIPKENEELFSYKAGQFLTLKVPYDGKNLIRCYSLASSPDVDSEHKVTIKRVVDGRISNWINDDVKPGDFIDVMPPAGIFYLNDGDNDVVLFGGGSGVTPVISILKTALKKTRRKVKLVYANRDEQSVIFKEELAALESGHKDRLQVIYLFDNVDGFLSEERVIQEVTGHDGGEFYVCGPGPFMDTVENTLLKLGEDKRRIHVERFVSPPDPEEAAAQEAAARAAVSGSTVTAFEVYLDGETQEVPYESGDTLLQSMLKAGIDAPFSCEEGMCAACICTVEGGDTVLGNNEVLSREELDEGLTLACQCRPVSGPLKVVFED
ncbi:ferredoxin--NADP reductase [Endozoicomonas montiporae]|uniref:3-ketosteroid 9alpha-monooxygenase subunit B n=1 Tax=Endozoicomonas montiporae CL-33 TaxID=570277 RepID=A0A142B9U8_9GAMM|nr:ferredoxin--NADP reductase [Endozoicomonas montiporae]AMO55524.1 3-ketosteroid 9alpha-monooxygenase subunit B [Endozoicomonas montiporae CL-33]